MGVQEEKGGVVAVEEQTQVHLEMVCRVFQGLMDKVDWLVVEGAVLVRRVNLMEDLVLEEKVETVCLFQFLVSVSFMVAVEVVVVLL